MRLAIPRMSASQGISKKMIIGFTAIASAAVIGTVGMVGAQAGNAQPPAEFCENGNFKNHGQCVKAWKQQNKPGYGGNNTNNGDVNLHIDAEANGDNSTVNIIVNIYNTINVFN